MLKVVIHSLSKQDCKHLQLPSKPGPELTPAEGTSLAIYINIQRKTWKGTSLAISSPNQIKFNDGFLSCIVYIILYNKKGLWWVWYLKKSLVCEGSGAKYNMWAVERMGSAQCVLLDVLLGPEERTCTGTVRIRDCPNAVCKLSESKCLSLKMVAFLCAMY